MRRCSVASRIVRRLYESQSLQQFAVWIWTTQKDSFTIQHTAVAIPFTCFILQANSLAISTYPPLRGCLSSLVIETEDVEYVSAVALLPEWLRSAGLDIVFVVKNIVLTRV